MDDARLSQHPVGRLIRELVRTGRAATTGDVRGIIERLAATPFDRGIVPVPTSLRGVAYQHHVLGAREDTLIYHLVKRVGGERQWPEGTTVDTYLDDLRRAVLAPAARLGLYERRGGHIAVTLTPTAEVLEVARRTPDSLPMLLVVYSADRGIILSGYQVSSLDRTGIPQEALWLK